MSEIRGIIPILPSIFHDDGAVDQTGMRNVIKYVLEAGAHGVAFPAMASEFYSLTDRERIGLTELIVAEVSGAVPVIGTATAQSPQAAIELARAVERSGVSAIMLMPPYVVRDSEAGVRRLFADLAQAVNVPLILQNAPPPLGAGYGAETIRGLMEQVPQIAYLKEETAPGGQKISKLLDRPPAGLKGVFGGAGGRYLMDELSRGVIGAMPACEITELHVRMFNLFEAGEQRAARDLYNRSLPLMVFQAVFRMNMTKEVLKRRGIIKSPHVRVGSTPLDDQDQKELSILLAELQELLLVPTLA